MHTKYIYTLVQYNRVFWPSLNRFVHIISNDRWKQCVYNVHLLNGKVHCVLAACRGVAYTGIMMRSCRVLCGWWSRCTLSIEQTKFALMLLSIRLQLNLLFFYYHSRTEPGITRKVINKTTFTPRWHSWLCKRCNCMDMSVRLPVCHILLLYQNEQRFMRNCFVTHISRLLTDAPNWLLLLLFVSPPQVSHASLFVIWFVRSFVTHTTLLTKNK